MNFMDEDQVKDIEVQEKLEQASKSDVSAGDFMTQHAIASAVGLENSSEISKYAHQIERLNQWATMKGAKDTADKVWQIKQLANRIGGPTIGNNWAKHLATYAFLEMERMKLDQQLQKYASNQKTHTT